MKPLIRWVGGKTKLLKEIRKHVPCDIKRYIEPFVGGGAVLLDIDANIPAIASDSNWDLINFYRVLKESPEDLVYEFRGFGNDETSYYKTRDWDRQEDGWFDSITPLARAARFLYLNKTSFQGLWRVNKKGQHNVPYSHPKKININDSDVACVSARLQTVDFVCEDFENAIDRASDGDFIYVDPPYIPVDNSKAFVGYTDGLFHYSDQVRLRDALVRAGERGARFLASNSDTQLSRELYKNFTIETVQVKRLVAPNSESRVKITEILVRNF